MISISQEMLGGEGFPGERGESIGQKVMKGGKDQTKSHVDSWGQGWRYSYIPHTCLFPTRTLVPHCPWPLFFGAKIKLQGCLTSLHFIYLHALSNHHVLYLLQ